MKKLLIIGDYDTSCERNDLKLLADIDLPDNFNLDCLNMDQIRECFNDRDLNIIDDSVTLTIVTVEKSFDVSMKSLFNIKEAACIN